MNIIDMLNRRKHASDQPIGQDLSLELAEIAFNGVQLNLIIGGVATTLIIASFGYWRHNSWDYPVAVLLGFFSFVRLAVSFVYRFKCRRGQRTDLVPSIQKVYAASTILYSLSYGIGAFLSFRSHQVSDSFLFTLGSFMLCGGFSSRFGVEPRILQIAGFSILIPLGFGILFLPATVAGVGCLLVVLYGVVYLNSTRSQFALLTQQLRSRRKLRSLAERDELTGLFNRRYLYSTLESVSRAQNPYAVLFLDLDRFKAVNDTFGHAVGDTLLRQVSDRLLRTIRRVDAGRETAGSEPLPVSLFRDSGDIVARFGGDEFAILMSHGASAQAAEALAKRITQTLTTPFSIDGNEILIGVSIGIRVSMGQNPDPEEVMKKADEALYQAKRSGGGILIVQPT